MKGRGGRARKARQEAVQRGLWAERFCALMLQAKGFRLLARRFRTPVGEIDLIAARKRLIIFVEVKFRASADEALGAIGSAQMDRIRRAAGLFIAQHPEWEGADQRFDVLAVSPWKLPIHIKNAW